MQGGVEKEGSREWNIVLKRSSSEPAYSAFSNTDRDSEGRQVLGEAEVMGTVLNTKQFSSFRKNNLAAKKSRDTRRMRENQLREAGQKYFLNPKYLELILTFVKVSSLD